MQVLGIIPARAGSKGIALKNLSMVCGKTLLRRAIESAQQATRISRLIVSTEDDRIAVKAHRCGCEVEYRPEALATDDATTLAVLQWHLAQADVKPDAVLCLQPTCPLRRPEDIDGAIGLMEKTDCDSVISVADVGANHPARMVGVWPDSSVCIYASLQTAKCSDGTSVTYPAMFAARQDLYPLYIRSGDIYLTRSATLVHSLTGNDCRAYTIPPDRHCNIDQPIDLVTAEALVAYHEGKR